MNDITEYIKENKAMQSFINDVRCSEHAHAYLITGDDELTVKHALKLMAKTLLCKNGACDNCDVCLRVENGNHPNVCEYSEYKVDAVKDIIEKNYIRPLEDGPKVFLLDKFDGVNERVQNKLLKTVEEPEENVIVIIGTTNDTGILNTVLSRVKKINLKIWTYDRIAKYLKFLGYDSDSIDFAVSLSGESLNVSKRIIDDVNAKALYKNIYEMLLNLDNSASVPRYIAVFKSETSDLPAALDMLSVIMSRALRDSINGESNEIADRYNVAAITNIIEKIADAKAKCRSYINYDNVVSTLLLDMLEIRFRTK